MRTADPSGNSAVARPTTLIRPPSRWPRLDLGALIRSHELLVVFAQREVKLRYRQTVLGAVWIVLAPALTAAIFSFVFSTVAHLPAEGVPYFLLAFAGMSAWTAFANGVNRLSQALVINAQMVTKIYFERLTLAAGTMLATLVDLAIVLVIVAGAMVGFRQAPPVWLVLLPVWLVGLLLLSAGLGLMAGALMVRYRDLGPIVTLGTQMLLYLSPVAYAATAVPGHLRSVFAVNPLVGLIGGFRWSLLGTTRPPAWQLGYGVGAGLIVAVAGLAVFRRQERGFADVI